MRNALLVASAGLVLLTGCGQGGTSDQPPRNVEQGLYVICSGKPRYCAVADVRDPDPEWKGGRRAGS